MEFIRSPKFPVHWSLLNAGMPALDRRAAALGGRHGEQHPRARRLHAVSSPAIERITASPHARGPGEMPSDSRTFCGILTRPLLVTRIDGAVIPGILHTKAQRDESARHQRIQRTRAALAELGERLAGPRAQITTRVATQDAATTRSCAFRRPRRRSCPSCWRDDFDELPPDFDEHFR